LLAAAKQLDWSSAAAAEVATKDRQHGRHEQRWIRRIDLSTVAGAQVLKDFPGATQIVRIENKRRDGDKAPRNWAYFISSLAADQADAQRLGVIIRSHWLIETGSHYIRDVVYGEDGCRCRTDHLPEILAIARSVGTTWAAHHRLTHATAHRTLAHDLRAISNLPGIWIAPGPAPRSARKAAA